MRVLLCEANTRVRGKLSMAGLLGEQGEDGYASTFDEALRNVMEPTV
jgi:hypothetical protein